MTRLKLYYRDEPFIFIVLSGVHMITNMMNTTHEYGHYYTEMKSFPQVTVWHYLTNPSSYKVSLVMREPAFLHMRKQRRRSAAQLISAFVFATRIAQSLCFLNPKFQASSHLLWMYSPVYFGPGRKPRRPVFSLRGSSDDPRDRFYPFPTLV